MASVFQRNGIWYLRVRDAAGQWQKVRAEGARGKTEAKRLAEELARRLERERLGLAPVTPEDGGGTLAELLEWWLATYSAGSPSHGTNESSIRKHLIGSDLSKLLLIAVRPEKLEAFLQAKAQEELSPQSINHLRGFISRAFNAARKVGRWAGANPAASVKKRRIPKRKPDFLRPNEVPAVLRQVSPAWRPLFAVAIYTGLRKGELFGLRKADVDLSNRMLKVAHSHDRETTKGGHEEVIPIAAEALPWLEAAIGASKSELVFPAADGGLIRRDAKLEGMLRRALGRAGIAPAWDHVCRRKGCGHKERQPDGELRRCPTDNRKLWPKPQVRPIRFHDLRHTTASLLMMSGANPVAVQRVMRHTDPKITTEVYGHLLPGYLRAEVDRLAFGVAPPAAPARAVVPVAVNAERFVPAVSPTASQKGEGLGLIGREPFESEAFKQCGILDSNQWPLAPEATPHDVQDIPAGVNPSQIHRVARGTESRASQRVGTITENFVPVVSPPRRLRAAEVEPERLLTVRQVAESLGVSTATVYKLVDRGELEHLRIGNAIRFSPTALPKR